MISVTKVLTAQQCFRKYNLRYIERVKSLPSVSLLRGIIGHLLMEQWLQGKPREEWYKHPEIEQIMITRESGEWTEEMEKDFDKQMERLEVFFDMLTNPGNPMGVDEYILGLPEKFQNGQLEIEQLFDVELAGVDVAVTGKFDVFDVDANRVIDWKFVGRHSGLSPNYVMQGVVYAAMVHKAFMKPDDPPPQVTFVEIVLTKTPRMVLLEVPMDGPMRTLAVRAWTDFKVTAQYIGQHGTLPDIPNLAMCSWCEYQNLCYPDLFKKEKKE